MAPGHSMPDDAQEDNSAWNEMRLLYPTDPATTRGAGNNPGLGSSQRGFSFAQNDNPNTPFKGNGISPVAPNYTGRGPLSPLDRTTASTSPGTLHGQSVLASEDFGHGRSAMG